MSFQKKALHFWGAIWRSLVGLLVGGLLSGAIVFVPHVVFSVSYNNQFYVILVGIITSILSALILRVIDKYNESLAAAETIGSQVVCLSAMLRKAWIKVMSSLSSCGRDTC